MSRRRGKSLGCDASTSATETKQRPTFCSRRATSDAVVQTATQAIPSSSQSARITTGYASGGEQTLTYEQDPTTILKRDSSACTELYATCLYSSRVFWLADRDEYNTASTHPLSTFTNSLRAATSLRTSSTR